MTPPAVTAAPAGLEALLGTASALAGRPLTVAHVLSRREDRDGGGTVVVAVLDPVGAGARVVVKAGPPALVDAGARAQRLAHAVAGARLAVPAVLGHEPGVVVMEHAAGPTLADRLRAGEVAAAGRVGAALAALHACDVSGVLPVRDLAGHFADLALPQPDGLARTGLAPRLGDRVAAVARDVVAAAGGVPAPARLVHRDVHPRQVLVGSRVWLLDWDLAAGGDPALDLGNLVASVRTTHSDAVAGRTVDALLAGYAGGDTCDALARVAVHEAFTYVRLACKRARLGGASAAGAVEDLLGRARRVLVRLP